MQLPGSRISTSLPTAGASGFRQWIHRFGPLAGEQESHSLCLGDFFQRENEERNLIAPVAEMPRRTRSFLTGTPLSPIDATFKFGLCGGSLMALIPTASRIPSNAAQNFASRSCSR